MRHGRRAFTLVELLVVVSILVLLIAILLPSLRRARGHAKQTVCGSNLKQIGTALAMYADGAADWLPVWSQWHVWGYFGTDRDGTAGDDAGPAWTEQLRADASLPGINILRCPAFPPQVAVSYFESAYAIWTRQQQQSTRRSLIHFPAEFVLSGDCTNRMFYAPPFGTNALLNINDADMDDATQRGVDWDYPIHLPTNSNVLFGDGHVSALAAFDPAQMTHDLATRAVDWGAIKVE